MCSVSIIGERYRRVSKSDTIYSNKRCAQCFLVLCTLHVPYIHCIVFLHARISSSVYAFCMYLHNVPTSPLQCVNMYSEFILTLTVYDFTLKLLAKEKELRAEVLKARQEARAHAEKLKSMLTVLCHLLYFVDTIIPNECLYSDGRIQQSSRKRKESCLKRCTAGANTDKSSCKFIFANSCALCKYQHQHLQYKNTVKRYQ